MFSSFSCHLVSFTALTIIHVATVTNCVSSLILQNNLFGMEQAKIIIITYAKQIIYCANFDFETAHIECFFKNYYISVNIFTVKLT